MRRPTGPVDAIDPDLLLRAYALGVFPMSDARDDESVYWVEPRIRAVLPLDGFHLSRRLRRTIASERFRLTVDTAFDRIIALCAEAAEDRPDTWINAAIEQAFVTLHRRGYAHSVEVWDGEHLAGGLYGLALGRAFFGESMVSRARDASKVALAALVARLRAGGFDLLDCQFQTPHLASLGAIEVPKVAYNALLGSALGTSAGGVLAGGTSAEGDFGAFDALGAGAAPLDADTVSGPAVGKRIVQLLGQTS
ncbi:leucyl/phenylalanyl-tRNA--protein transferase [Sphingomonas sp. Leaf33]|uniref:leucyl/phenylalanyl-tRNA--protein transferase n=1 Tax=Sphingomonas sp. Leaf33 TaxID=1736215 RepID=UPI0006F5F4F4|nr:leucyl/phenylalanyl-tRNA--protein transferase [Sphingomonas sp. Leaf33]KQN19583.1 leucyl/phenylalanyl-tRNA--protein transferase [Sphingomonas sp. Leaf33]